MDATGVIDEGAVCAWLSEAAAMREPIVLARIGQGQSNLTFLATDADGRRVVLRRPPLGELLASAHDVAREHRILTALEATAVPTPPVIAFTEDPAVTDVPLLALDFVDGLVLDDLGDAGRTGGALPRALATIHAVDLAATGLSDLASHKPYAARQLRRWRRQWEHVRTQERPEVAELADRLEAAIPEQREVTLVHGDFHVLNVILTPDAREVRAVLDWELCTLGDPLADVGGLLAYWPEAPVAEYLAASGRDVAPREIAFWHALGLWKVAVILEGIRRRSLDDPRNARAAGPPDTVLFDSFIARAQRVAADAGL